MPQLELRDLSGGYPGRPVFQNLSFSARPGRIIGLSGPSGCGKTTLGRVICGLQPPLSGSIHLNGGPLAPKDRKKLQYLWQHPVTAVNPRWKIGRILSEGGIPDPALAERCGYKMDWAGHYPHELSGGQMARVSLLRALSARPAWLVADEITAALDPVAQQHIWTLLRALCTEAQLGIIAISHDQALLDRIADYQLQSTAWM